MGIRVQPDDQSLETQAAAARPHWLPRAVWLGKKEHEWVIQCFGEDDPFGQQRAERWAAEGSYQTGNRRAIWRVEVPDDVVVYKSHHVPATTRLEQVYP